MKRTAGQCMFTGIWLCGGLQWQWMMVRMVGGWVFLLVPAHPGTHGQRAVKQCCVVVQWQWQLNVVECRQSLSLYSALASRKISDVQTSNSLDSAWRHQEIELGIWDSPPSCSKRLGWISWNIICDEDGWCQWVSLVGLSASCYLQCFDVVGWVTGRTWALEKKLGHI